MSEGQTKEVFSQEIAELEAKLEAKKKELLQSGVEQSEKHTFKEVVRDHAFTKESATPVSANTNTQAKTSVALSKEDQEKIDLLVVHAFTNGINSAVSEAKKTGSPYLIDMLHDRLVDEYYAKLLQARKIKEV
jgi:hypothetical protein